MPEPPRDHLVLREAPARLGELCIALGSPLGDYPESAALGIVSGLARSIPQQGRPIEHALQTDVAINPGNSGGPLIDVEGSVIGVNQSVDVRGTGVGFAIPAGTAGWVAAELIESGTVVRAALGVSVVSSHVELEGVTRRALTVAAITGETAEGGLQENDVILAVDRRPIMEKADLYAVLTKDKIGKPTQVDVLRGDSIVQLMVVPTKLGQTST